MTEAGRGSHTVHNTFTYGGLGGGGVKGKPTGMQTLYFPLNTTKDGSKTFFHLSFGLRFPAPVRRCVFASERIFPAVSELIQRSTERFRTLGRAPLTHCVSAVNSRSVSCISAVFGPILELTQEIGPF